MKHLHKYNDYEIVNQYLKDINNAKSINELTEIEEKLETLNLDEGLYDFVKRQVNKVKDFFDDAGKAVDFLLMGDEEEEEPIVYNKEVLLQYNEPTGYDTTKYKLYNDIDATDHKLDFNKIFYSHTFGHKTKANLKDKPLIRVSKYNNANTGDKTEYVIALYALPDELLDTELLQRGGEIESTIPSIFVYLKHIAETFPEESNFNSEFKKFETELKQQYKELLKLPEFYDKKIHRGFDEKIFTKALSSVKIDMKKKG